MNMHSIFEWAGILSTFTSYSRVGFIPLSILIFVYLFIYHVNIFLVMRHLHNFDLILCFCLFSDWKMPRVRRKSVQVRKNQHANERTCACRQKVETDKFNI